MAKAVKSAVKAFAVTFLVVTGTAFIFGGAGAFTGGLSALTIFGSTVNALAISALSAVGTAVQGLFSKGVDATAENFGSKVSTRSPTAPRKIIYGKVRIGGTITHIETSGTDNNKLSMIVALAGHEVESLEEVLINDTVLTTTSVATFQYATNSKFINTDNDNKFDSNGTLLRYKFKDGSQTTADSTVTANTSLTTSDKFVGISYIFIEMIFDSEAFGGGIPPMAFVVKGKKVFDPRNNTTAWSDNPALCVRDYITNTTYGLKATNDEVNDTTTLGGFKTAANTCDNGNTITTATVNGAVNNTTTVNLNNSATNTLIDVGQTVSGTGISGSPTVIKRTGNQITLSTAQTISNGVTLTFTEKAYTANGFTNMSADGGGVIEGLLSSCAGKLSYIDGKFIMFAGASVTPDMTITDDNIIAPISVQTMQSRGETFNQVKSVYVDANNNYTTTDAPLETTVNPLTTNTFLSEDTPTGEAQANYKKTLEVQLPFTDTTTMAQRLQRTALLHTRQKTALSVTCNISYMQLQPFDWVYLTNERLGYTNKVFEVLSTNLEFVEDEGVPILATRLELKEINSNVYAFASSSYTNPVDEGSSVSTGSFSVSPPTSLAVATTLEITGHDLNVSWTNNPDDLVQGTEVFYGTSSGTYIGSFIVGKGTAKESINGVKASTTYYIAVRHFSANNVFSALTSEVTVTTGTAPISYSTGGGNVGGTDTINILGKNLVLNRFNSTSGDEDNENYTFLNSGNGALGGITSFQNSDTERVQLFFGEDIGGDFTNQFIALDADWDLGKGGANGSSTGTSKLIIKGKAYGSSTGSAGATSTIATFNAITNTDGYAFPTVELAPTTISGSTTTPVVVVSQGSAPSTTTNKLYNIGGSLYWNGAVVDTGAGDITGVTITTSGQSGLTGGASFTSGDATFTLAIASTINGSKTFSDDVVVQGDLTVEGTTTTIDTTNLDVQDKNITLNYGTGDTSANANGAGITIQDAVSATQDATLTWNTTNDSFNFSHNLNFADNVKVQLGTGNDLQIYHDGSNSNYIKSTTSDIYLRNEGDNDKIYMQATNSGTLANYLTIDGSSNDIKVHKNLHASDNVKAIFGAGSDLQIYHDTSNSLVRNFTGALYIQNDQDDGNIIFRSDNGSGGIAEYIVINGGNGSTMLKHYGSTKLVTTSTGVDITGSTTTDGMTSSQTINVNSASGSVDARVGFNNSVKNGWIGIPAWDNTSLRIYGTSPTSGNTNEPAAMYRNGAWSFWTDYNNTSGNGSTSTAVFISTGGSLNVGRGDIQIGGTTVISSARNLTNIVNLTATGTATLNALTVDNISINAEEIASTSNMTLNSGNDIILDADGGNVMLKDNSVWFGNFNHNGNNLAIDAKIQDGDIKFRGNDGGSTITALTLDMSDAGTASFNHDIHMIDNAYLRMGAGGDLIAFSDGTNALINANNGDLTFDVAGNINLDADGGFIVLKDGGVTFGAFGLSGGNFLIKPDGVNQDIVFNGNDGGSAITALTLDMSDSGKALFNAGANFGNSIDVTGSITTDGLTTSADINFGDDDKALFGASNDLKIYHSANNQSYIHEVGSGDLNILATNLKLQDAGGSNRVVVNSTGIDVTGTVTSDGLTVDGTISAYRAGFTQGVQLLGDSGGNQIIGTATNDKKLIIKNLAATQGIEIIAGNKVMDIARGGDISFYEDTGSTAKFFWDASAEKLGIGTTTVGAALTVHHALPSGNYLAEFRSTGNSHATIDLRADGTGDPRIFFDLNGASPFAIGVDNSDGDKFKISGNYNLGTNDRFVIDSSGKVGISEVSPDGKLHIKGGTATGNASHVLFENTQGSKVFAIGGGASGVTNNNLYIRNVTDNTTPMVITDAGATTFAGNLTVTSELNVGQQITASGGITTDQSGQTISGFSTIRVGDALIGQDVATLTTTSASQTNRILASSTTYRTLKVLVQIKSSTNFHATEILLTHNGTTVYMTEYATIFSNTSLATFDADISGGNIRLLIDPNQSASTEFKFNVSGIEA